MAQELVLMVKIKEPVVDSGHIIKTITDYMVNYSQ